MSVRNNPPFDSDLVTRCLNFHGHDLLKRLLSDNPEQIHSFMLQNISYKNYLERKRINNTLGKSDEINLEELHTFICHAADKLFTSRKSCYIPTEDAIAAEERNQHLIPMERLLNISTEQIWTSFIDYVNVGHILLVAVVRHRFQDDSMSLDVIGFDPGPHRYLAASSKTVGFTSQVLLYCKDTSIPRFESISETFWPVGTRLRVEVLSVDRDTRNVVVGTRGETLTSETKDKIKLGKIQSVSLPESLRPSTLEDGLHLSDCYDKMSNFHNPLCIKSMTKLMDLDLKDHSSMIAGFKHNFEDDSLATNLRKSQMRKWAHKSVADGVQHFKKGNHEGAFHALNKALQIDPVNVEAFVAKGALLANLGQYQKAVDDFEHSLSLNPQHSNAKKYLGETLVELGKQHEESKNLQKAELCYTRCLELVPDHYAANKALETFERKASPVKFESNINQTVELIKDLMRQEKSMEKEERLASIEKERVREIEKERVREKETDRLNSIEKERVQEREKERARGFQKERVRGMEKRIHLDSSSKSHDVDDVPSKRKPRSSSDDEPVEIVYQRKKSLSLSPLAQKMAMQENLWVPPSNIHKDSSFMNPAHLDNVVVPIRENNGMPAPILEDYNVPIPDQFFNVHPNLPIEPKASSSNSQPMTEDQKYKACVNDFLKRIAAQHDSYASKQVGKERADIRKRSRSRSQSAKEVKKFVIESSSSESGSSSSSSESSSDEKLKKKRAKKKKKRKKKKEVKTLKKKKKAKEAKKKKGEKLSLKDSKGELAEFEILEKKLKAYYEKMDCMKAKGSIGDEEVLKATSPVKIKQKFKVHPAFQQMDNSDSDDDNKKRKKNSSKEAKENKTTNKKDKKEKKKKEKKLDKKRRKSSRSSSFSSSSSSKSRSKSVTRDYSLRERRSISPRNRVTSIDYRKRSPSPRFGYYDNKPYVKSSYVQRRPYVHRSNWNDRRGYARFDYKRQYERGYRSRSRSRDRYRSRSRGRDRYRSHSRSRGRYRSRSRSRGGGRSRSRSIGRKYISRKNSRSRSRGGSPRRSSSPEKRQKSRSVSQRDRSKSIDKNSKEDKADESPLRIRSRSNSVKNESKSPKPIDKLPTTTDLFGKWADSEENYITTVEIISPVEKPPGSISSLSSHSKNDNLNDGRNLFKPRFEHSTRNVNITPVPITDNYQHIKPEEPQINNIEKQVNGTDDEMNKDTIKKDYENEENHLDKSIMNETETETNKTKDDEIKSENKPIDISVIKIIPTVTTEAKNMNTSSPNNESKDVRRGKSTKATVTHMGGTAGILAMLNKKPRGTYDFNKKHVVKPKLNASPIMTKSVESPTVISTVKDKFTQDSSSGNECQNQSSNPNDSAAQSISKNLNTDSSKLQPVVKSILKKDDFNPIFSEKQKLKSTLTENYTEKSNLDEPAVTSAIVERLAVTMEEGKFPNSSLTDKLTNAVISSFEDDSIVPSSTSVDRSLFKSSVISAPSLRDKLSVTSKKPASTLDEKFSTLEQFENFLSKAKEKKALIMKQHNKEFKR